MTYLENAIYTLQRWGVDDVLLPFVLVFTLAYVVLNNVPLFKNAPTGNKNAMTVTVALALSLAIVFPHVTGNNYYGADLVEIINNSIPYVGLWLVLGLSVLMVIGAFSATLAEGSFFKGLLGFASFFFVVYIFASSAGLIDNLYIWNLFDPDLIAVVMAIATCYLFISYLTDTTTTTPGGTKKDTIEKIIDAVKESFK
jgi:hypothetical protein